MAFDDTQPTDNTKIRDLGVVIRPNFVAIETGDSSFEPEKVNLLNRTTATVPIDPVAIATSYIMYSKEDSSGDPQLYGIDPNSNIMQFTGIAPSLATNGYVFLPGNLLLQWFSFTVKNDDNNNFPIAFAASPYAITGSEVTNNATDFDFVKPIILSATEFKTILLKATGSAQTTPKACTFFAIGQAQT